MAREVELELSWWGSGVESSRQKMELELRITNRSGLLERCEVLNNVLVVVLRSHEVRRGPEDTPSTPRRIRSPALKQKVDETREGIKATNLPLSLLSSFPDFYRPLVADLTGTDGDENEHTGYILRAEY